MESPRPRFIGDGRSWQKVVPRRGCEALNEGRQKKVPGRENEILFWGNQEGLATCKSYTGLLCTGRARGSHQFLWTYGSREGLISAWASITSPCVDSHSSLTPPWLCQWLWKGDKYFLLTSKIWWVLQRSWGSNKLQSHLGILGGTGQLFQVSSD